MNIFLNYSHNINWLDSKGIRWINMFSLFVYTYITRSTNPNITTSHHDPTPYSFPLYNPSPLFSIQPLCCRLTLHVHSLCKQLPRCSLITRRTSPFAPLSPRGSESPPPCGGREPFRCCSEWSKHGNKRVCSQRSVSRSLWGPADNTVHAINDGVGSNRGDRGGGGVNI